jgi:hypothetical protein
MVTTCPFRVPAAVAITTVLALLGFLSLIALALSALRTSPGWVRATG